MQLKSFAPSDVERNPAISARMGEPDPEVVKRICLSYGERVERSLPHQIQPGVVRTKKGTKTVEVIVGGHRLAAVAMYNEVKGEDDPELAFDAIVVTDGDEDALITAIQENEFRTALDPIERATCMARLQALNKTQAEIGRAFGLAESTVSNILKVANLESKYKKAIKDGLIEADAAVVLAGLPVDAKERDAILEECIRHKQKFDDIQTKMSAKQKIEEVASKVTQLQTAKSEITTQTKDVKEKLKEAETAVKTAGGELAKTTDTKQLVKMRDAHQAAMEARDKIAEEAARLDKEKEKVAKQLEKAKEAKDKVVESTKVSKVTPQQVKEEAAKRGVDTAKKTGKAAHKKTNEAKPLTKQQFYDGLEAMSADEEGLSEPVKVLIGRIEACLDGEQSFTQLKNSFVKCCRDKFPPK